MYVMIGIRGKEQKPMLSKREQLAKALVFATTVSGMLIGNICIGYWLGLYADDNFGVNPYGRILGISLGMISAVYSIYFTLKKDYFRKQ